MMVIFCSYYAGISMFSHAHIVNGSSVVHSHLGGASDHEHSDSQYAIIDILSHFQSECAAFFCGTGFPFYHSVKLPEPENVLTVLSGCHSRHALRGPPQSL